MVALGIQRRHLAFQLLLGLTAAGLDLVVELSPLGIEASQLAVHGFLEILGA